jgi:transcriptional regulator with XRE-family HTH domain
MHIDSYCAVMRNEEWSAARIRAALAKLEDAGHSQPEMARTAGVSQSTVNRWSRGKVQPGYSAVRKLAVSVWRRYPEVARELVEASGYAWAEPTDAPEPEPAISPALLASIRREVDPADQQRVIDALERTLRGEPPPSGPGEADVSREGRAAS